MSIMQTSRGMSHIYIVRWLHINFVNCIWKTLHVTCCHFYRSSNPELSKECKKDLVRQAFLDVAEKYYPTHKSKEQDFENFKLIETVYCKLLSHCACVFYNLEEKNEDYIFYNVKKSYDVYRAKCYTNYLPAQNRNFLMHGGYGSGTLRERIKQFSDHRANIAAANICGRQLVELGDELVDNFIVDFVTDAEKINEKSELETLIERLVKKLIIDSECYRQKQKEIVNTHINTRIDLFEETEKVVPEWIRLGIEIYVKTSMLRDSLVCSRARIGKLPLEPEEKKQWANMIKKHRCAVDGLNTKIRKYNLIKPPFLKKMFTVSLDSEAQIILNVGKPKTEDKQSLERQEESSILHLFSWIFSKVWPR